MLLSALFLTGVANVNTYQESEQFLMTEGDATDVYIQLRDLSVQTAFQGYKNPGRRYIPASGATLTVSIDTTDSAKASTLTKACTQPFASDGSIWKFTINSTDPVVGTKRIKLNLSKVR